MTDRPGWATGVPSTAPWARYVTCGCCGRGMSWAMFIKHLPQCQGGAGRTTRETT